MKKKVVLCIAIGGLVLLGCTLQGAKGECCYPDMMRGLCGDCTEPIGFYCAAMAGGCNALGCRCDGGCLRGQCGRVRRSTDEEEMLDDSLDADLTGNDEVRRADASDDVREGKMFLRRRSVVADVDALRDLDSEVDGKLAPHDIDAEVQ